jgi:integrase
VAGTVRSRSGTPFKPSVSRKYEAMLRLHVVPRLGDVPIEGLLKRDVQAMVDVLAAEEGAETARKALTALRVALRVAERDGLVDANPCVGVRVPSDGREERPARILIPEECAAIVDAARAMDARLGRSLCGPLFALAFGTGLRSGELLALVWGPDGLDLEGAVVHVRRSLDRNPGPDALYPIVPPKSRASRRDVPLPPDDLTLLRQHRLATRRPGEGALVFADDQGRPLNAKGVVRYAWRSAVRAAGIAEPLPTLHDARHAYATHALRAGLTLHAVARLLGHGDVSLVARRYGHALPDELAEAGRMLERFRKSWTA